MTFRACNGTAGSRALPLRIGARRALLGTLCSLPAACAAEPAPVERSRPELVVLVILDTLAGQHVSHLGYDRATTPRIDALAADGVTFEQAITPASYTVASIPSLLTGRLPDRHGLTWYDRQLPEREATIGELARAGGYSTFAAVAVQNGGPRYNNLQGFDESLEVWVGQGPPGAERFEFKGRAVHMPRADEFLPIAEERLDRLAPDERLFLYLHVLEPHDPYDPPLPFKRELLDERFPGPFVESQEPSLHDVPRDQAPAPEVIAAVTHLYDANILWVDYNVGRLMDLLHARGLYDEALVVLTADHGEAFWEHGVRSHGFRLYEEEIRVPLVVKFPRSWGRAGRRVPGLVSTLDVVPSLCDWLALPAPDLDFDGRSLEALAVDPASAPTREAVFLRARRDVHRFGLRFTDEKIVVHLPPEGQGEPTCELYDLSTDPGERRDLAAERPARAAELKREVLSILEQLDGAAHAQRPAEVDPLPGAERELLEALGYAGD